MLGGEPPYTGSTAQAVLGKIIAGELASATKERSSVPANVDAAISKALEKLPADRFTGAQDFAQALADPGFRHGETAGVGAEAPAGPWKWVAVLFAALFVLSAAVASWLFLRPEPPLSIERFVAPFGRGQEPTFVFRNAFVLSPDGSMLVFRGAGNQLWVRRWADVDPSSIRGTEAGLQPADGVLS